MHPTVLGLVLLPAAVALVFRPVGLIRLAFVAAVFQAAAALVIGGFGLQPGLVPALLLILYVVTQYGLGMRYPREGPALLAMLPLMALLVYAVLSVFVLPDLFAGEVMVAPQKLAPGSPWLAPLAFRSGNITQPLYLAVNTAVAIAVALVMTQRAIPYGRIVAAYLASGYLVVGLVFWEFLARTIALPYPRAILQSNPGWMIADQAIAGIPRLQGPFSEPAALGAWLAGLCFCCMILVARGYRRQRPALLLALASGAMLLSTSTTGILCLLIEAPLALLFAGRRAGRFARVRLARTLGLIALAGGLALVPLVILRPAYLDVAGSIVSATLAKGNSASYLDRTALDAAALATIGPTDGLGVGWGGFRASSLLPGLLANGGIPALAAVIWLALGVTALARRAVALAPHHPGRVVVDAFGAAVCGQVMAALLSAPMIDSPAFFIELGCLVGVAARMTAMADAWSAPYSAAYPVSLARPERAATRPRSGAEA